MGSSARKKKDKAKDFKKPKLRVGKTKAKPDNFTDTSFKAKSITVNQQSLSLDAKSPAAQFLHYLSLASSSKSDTQRRDALAFLTSTIASNPATEALPTSAPFILEKLLPLILDGSSSVRTNLLKLLAHLPAHDVADGCSERALLYIRAGMTSLAPQIRDDSVSALSWLLTAAKTDVVDCAGGWVKTLKAFTAMMGWTYTKEKTGWSSAPKGASTKDGKSFSKMVFVLAQFLKVGLVEERQVEKFDASKFFPLWDVGAHGIPNQRNPYAYLNLFGAPRDEESEMYMDCDHRRRVFKKLFFTSVERGVEGAKKEGGEMGRAAAVLSKVLVDGMAGEGEVEDL